MALVLQAAGKTDVGLVRTNNEDNLGYDTRSGIFVVCDGMGGQAAGERASKIAVDTVLAYFSPASKNSDNRVVGATFDGVSERANALARAIQLANQAICEEAAQKPTEAGMGSTIVAALVEGNFFSVANVGDSRVYLIRDGSIQQLTNDHSLLMEQVRRGVMTAEEAEQSALQNVIVRALGSEDTIESDLADHELQPGDILLLCTDGLTRRTKDETILDIVVQTPDLNHTCEQLIESAKSAGSDDNITCLLVQVILPSWRDRLFGWHRRQSQNSL
jgi:serine/threonine protein phosphatase PrpC